MYEYGYSTYEVLSDIQNMLVDSAFIGKNEYYSILRAINALASILSVLVDYEYYHAFFLLLAVKRSREIPHSVLARHRETRRRWQIARHTHPQHKQQTTSTNNLTDLKLLTLKLQTDNKPKDLQHNHIKTGFIKIHTTRRHLFW